MIAFTSIEQSKKLAEFLPLETADMDYIPIVNLDGEYSPSVNVWDNEHIIDEGWIPSWSLAALLDVLPNKLQIVLAINDFQGDRKEKYCIGSVEHDKYDCFADNPVDACYELILKLNKLKLM